MIGRPQPGWRQVRQLIISHQFRSKNTIPASCKYQIYPLVRCSDGGEWVFSVKRPREARIARMRPAPHVYKSCVEQNPVCGALHRVAARGVGVEVPGEDDRQLSV